MPFDCELPDDARREKILLSFIFRARHSCGFRRKDERIIGAGIDAETGLEHSAADLLPEGQGLRGPEFAMAIAYQPEEFAKSCLLRNEHDGSKPDLAHVRAIQVVIDEPDAQHPGATQDRVVLTCPIHETGRAEEEVAHLRRRDATEKGRFPSNARTRIVQGRDAWDRSEAEAVSEMTYRFQRTFLDFAQKGWFRLEAPLPYEPDARVEVSSEQRKLYGTGVDSKGMPFMATLTPLGLEAAEQQISRDPFYSRGAFSSVAAMDGDMRAKVVQRNPWAAEIAAREESGRS